MILESTPQNEMLIRGTTLQSQVVTQDEIFQNHIIGTEEKIVDRFNR